jgi:hypothetical protein
MKQLTIALVSFVVMLAACKKSNSGSGSSNPYVYSNIVFDADDYQAPQFFSTFDTSFHTPLPQSSMTSTQIKNIDLVYSYYDVGPGEYFFVDPISASQSSDMDGFGDTAPWLSSSTQTYFYVTNLTAEQFAAAKTNTSLIGTYFKDSTAVTLEPGNYYGTGLSAGFNPIFAPDQVIGFKNVESGKRGLIHIAANQEADWPEPINDHNTLVDIVKEK